MVYPEEAIAQKVQGRIFIEFVIEKDGSITAAKAKQSSNLGFGLAEEAVRVVAAMPNWQPAKIEDKPVRSLITLPITFKLEVETNPISDSVALNELEKFIQAVQSNEPKKIIKRLQRSKTRI